MQMLEIVKLLVDNLAENKATYCHFKSNEHLDAALWGDTDLDILFDSEQVSLVEDAIFRAGFIRMKAVGNRKYQGIEDYIGIDDKEGKIVHIHAHYQLVGGESGVKPYHIKLEKQLLNNAQVYSSDCKILVARPEDELLLLLVRAALKLSVKNRWTSKFKDKLYSGDDLREFRWLVQRVSLDSLIFSLPSEFNNEQNILIFKKLFKDGLTRQCVAQLYDANRYIFDGWRYLGFKQAALVRINYFKVRLLRKLKVNLQTPQFRTFEDTGLIIAILGCDGAGKSTQNTLVPRELRKKVDVLYMYMGSGDGHASWHRYPMRLLIDLKSKFKKGNKSITEGEKNTVTSEKLSLKGIFKILWATSLAFERKKKLKKISAWKAKGGLVVCDRYPQTSVMGFNDGPLLCGLSNSKSRVLRRLSEWEFATYGISSEVSPDLVIKLWAEVNELKERRPEMDIQMLERKQQAILDLNFCSSVRVVNIHSTGGAEGVFASIMKEIHTSFISNFQSVKS